jgi:Protein of unknown function (DUF2510)
MEAHQPPSGWYIDPADPSRERYWDGTVWTDQYRTAPTRVLQSPERIVEEERVLPQEEVPPEDRSGLARCSPSESTSDLDSRSELEASAPPNTDVDDRGVV